MLALFCVSCLFVGSFGSSISSLPNYFVDLFEEATGEFTLYYPYPMDMCVKTGIFQYDHAIYSCSADGLTVTRTIYSDSDCETEDSSEEFTEADIASNGAYDFNCGGVTNYMTLTVCLTPEQSIDSSDSSDGYDCDSCVLSATVTWAAGVCHYAGNGTTSERMQSGCDEDTSYTNNYDDADDECLIATSTLDSGLGCSYFGRINTDWGKLYVYSELNQCVKEGTALIAEPESSSSSSSEEETDLSAGGDDGNDDSDNDDSSGTLSDTSTVVVIAGVVTLLVILLGIGLWVRKKQKNAVLVSYGHRQLSNDVSVTQDGMDGVHATGAGTGGTTGAGPIGGANTNDDVIEAEASMDEVNVEDVDNGKDDVLHIENVENGGNGGTGDSMAAINSMATPEGNDDESDSNSGDKETVGVLPGHTNDGASAVVGEN